MINFILFLYILVCVLAAEQSTIDVKQHAHLLNNSPFYTFFGAFFTNLISEFGDRTFIIAAIMAARYNRAAVFLGALLGNTGMSLIGTVIGGASPLLLNQKISAFLGGIVFLYFGGRTLYCVARNIDDSSSDSSSEIERDLKKVHEKIDLNQQQRKKNKKKLATSFLAVFTSTFVQTFLGEFGDRSNFTTVALAASHSHLLMVVTGSISGQAVTTLLAVFGGRYLAKRISERVLKGISGTIFLFFAINSLYFFYQV